MKVLKFSDGLSLPLDVATQTLAFIARKGAGKTYAAGKLTELLLDAGVQCVVLDMVGNWYGLRLAADGVRQGFEIPVLGGLRGDIPLEAQGGELVADLVMESGRSVILDLSQFSQADRKRFATAFGIRLWQLKKAQAEPAPLHLVIEECQLIVPQMVRGDDARMVGIYEEIIRLGRNYGIGVSMISQRPQSVNKEVLTQTECLIVLQVNGAPERKALKEWIVHQGMDVSLVDELPGLPTGVAYVWSPQWLRVLKKVAIEKKTTFDASATPKVGQVVARRPLAPLDLEGFRKKMAATIERAKENDPAELRRQIASLKRQATTAAPATKTVEVPVLDAKAKGLLETIGHFSENILTTLKQFTESAIAVEKELKGLRTAVSGRMAPLPVRQVQAARPQVRQAVRQVTTNGTLPIGEQKVLRALIQYPNGLAREQLTVLTGYKRSSRDAYIARLQAKSYIDIGGPGVFVTPAGEQALPDAEPLPTGDALQQYHRARLPQGELAILQQLISAYPRAVTRDSLDEVTGYKRSSRDAYIARLRAKELVTEPTRGEVRASEHLF